MADISSVDSLDIDDIGSTKTPLRSRTTTSPRPKVHKRKPTHAGDDTDSLLIDEIEDEPESTSPSRRSARRPQPIKGKKTTSRPTRKDKPMERSSGSVDSLTLSDDDVTPCYRRKSSFATSIDSESMCVSTEPDCYRSSIVGTRHRQVRFNDDSKALEDQAAAKSVAPYFRKWKMKTIFQILEIYRASRRQEFIYFTQQVHLYNQEVQALQDRINLDLPLILVREEAVGAHRLILNRSPSLQRKFPLDCNLHAYFDTSYLYDQAKDEELDWEKPFRSKEIKPQANKTEGNVDVGLSATIKKLDVNYDSVLKNKIGYRDDDNLSIASSGGYSRYSEGNSGFMSAPGSRTSTPTSPRPILKKYGYVN